jgi:beta-glucosidase
MRKTPGLISIAALALTMTALTTHAETPDQRADALIKQMTLAEKIQMVYGYYATPSPGKNYVPAAESVPYSAGFVPGIARLGIPNQWETDAGLGVASHRTMPEPRPRTALPSGIATAATWNRDLAFKGGAMIGNEARLSGFNVQLAGGLNLLREPRNGRNFEYAGEDPLLAGTMVGLTIKGIQSNHIVATVKHFAFNDQETSRMAVDARIGDAAARTSDLMAFQIAIETGDPGSVMCSYNRVNGAYACENDALLNGVLKGDWGYKGYVMSDWGADHSTVEAAMAGLDQESAGLIFDKSTYFNAPLTEAVENGHVPQARLDDMVHRVLRSLIANGVFDDPVSRRDAEIDMDGHAAVTQADAEEAIVLLKNNGVLPLTPGVKSIAIIGGHADKGVLSGGGSSQVHGRGGMAVPNEGPNAFPGPMVFYPSSPMAALQGLSQAKITYIDGKDVAAAARLAAQSDVAIVFATQWTGESLDVPSLSLPNAQDALIGAVAKANKKTVVVLETGGPVTMPWVKQTAAVLEAWYPGTSGGRAIARVLMGAVNPSGHLPATFPVSEAQLPRPVIDGKESHDRVTANYDIEGAAVGYKWFDRQKLTPLFPFGHGLSYTRFSYTDLKVESADGTVRASFTVRNTGPMAGQTVPQIYVSPGKTAWESPKRLGGWDKVMLQPGEARTVSVTVDPRLLAVYDPAAKAWRIADDDYSVTLSQSAATPVTAAKVHLTARTIGVKRDW